MAGNFVFPGGMVDEEDRKFNIFKKHIDLNHDEIFHRLGGELMEEEALSFAVAAIRETLEEAGVFLANRDKNSQAGLEHACSLRLSEDLAKDWFVKLVATEGWRLTLSSLTRWSHWITPELMKRRFDTRFLIATMPTGQSCIPDSRETVRGLWSTPEEGLKGNLAGKIPLSPPTLVTLHELLKYPNLQALQVATKDRQWGRKILPRLVPLTRGALIVEPWDPMYRKKEIIIDPDDLAASVLPVGEPFSRIWYDEGLWKPVGLENAK